MSPIRSLAAYLQESTAEVERLFDVLSIFIAITDDPACAHVRVNLAFAKVLGIAPSQDLVFTDPDVRLPFTALHAGEPIPRDEFPLQRAVRTRTEVRDETFEIVHADGRRTALNVFATPLTGEDGHIRGGVAVAIDVTAQRKVMRQQRLLADASQALASSLEYESSLAELARLAVPVFGDYCVIDVLQENGAFQRVSFVVHDPAKREVGDALQRYPPSLNVDSPAAHAIRGGDVLVVNQFAPDLLVRAAQSREHLDLLQRFGARAFMMAPLRARGRTLGLLTVGSFDESRKYESEEVALVEEVAARAGLALDNALLYRSVQDANRLKEDFLATLSHELRTPLNALLGWTQMLKSANLDDASRRRALESVERNAHAQAVLINDLLDVSRVMTGKLRLQEQAVDLQAVVLAAVDSVRPAVRARQIDLGVSLTPLAGEVIGDPDRLQQVIWNLLSNAVKFTPPHGRVDLSVEQVGGAVQIAVADSGVGIDPAFLPHVFERFRQADSSTTRSHGGLGLGLAIVRHLVDLHGGTVTVESEGAGKGARFVVTLPFRQPTPAVAGGVETRAQTWTLRGVRVLAVDDDEDSRELLLMMLRAAGADVMVVSSAATALDVVGSFRPHVMVADIAMPNMNGYELLREIASRESVPPPAIALTGYTSAEDARRAAEAGFALHLCKPVDHETLIRAVAGLAEQDACSTD